jgi:hypothetical protein
MDDGGQLQLEIPTEAQTVLARARRRGQIRARAAAVPVDYQALNRMVRRQRAALTRAIKSRDPDKVVLACRDAVHEWRQPGSMWPDDWPSWQCALDDVLPWHAAVRLEDL